MFDQTEQSLKSLEALLGLDPFTADPEDNRDDEKFSYDQIKDYVQGGNVYKPPDSLEDLQLFISNPDTEKIMNYLGESCGKADARIKSCFANSDFSPNKPYMVIDPRTLLAQNGVIRYNSQQYTNLASFIANMPDNYTVIIPPGNYYESITFSRNIRLIAEGQVTISAPKKQSAIKCESIGGLIQGFTFQVSEKSATPVVNITSGQIKFAKCAFIGSTGPAVKAQFLSRADFIDCDFRDSDEFVLAVTDSSIVTCKESTFTNGKKGGICLQNNCGAFFSDCKISSNAEGVDVSDSASMVFRKCTISHHTTDGFKISSSSKFLFIDECNFEYNALNNTPQSPQFASVHMGQKASLEITNTKFIKNKTCVMLSNNAKVNSRANSYCDSEEIPIVTIMDNSTFASEKDEFSGNCHLGVKAVHNSVFNARNSVFKYFSGKSSAGIAASHKSVIDLTDCEFDTITTTCLYLMQTCKVNINSCKFNKTPTGIDLRNEVTATIQNSEFDLNQENCIHFAKATGEILVDSCKFTNITKNALLFTDDTHPIIKNCNFHNPPSSKGIKGINITNELSKPSFENCTFNNFMCGAFIENGGYPLFKGCIFTSCETAGVYISSAKPEFHDCMFRANNTAVTILSKPELPDVKSEPQFVHCSIEANTKFGCRIDGKNSRPTFVSCFIGTTGKIGIMSENYAIPLFDGCVFEENHEIHALIKATSQVTFSGCDLSKAISGHGLFIDPNGVCIMEKSEIHDESEGIITSGTLVLKEVKIYKCHDGVQAQNDSSNLTIQNSEIYDNLFQGVTILQGKVTIVGTYIHDNGINGITLTEDTNAANRDNIKNNKFVNNKNKDIGIREFKTRAPVETRRAEHHETPVNNQPIPNVNPATINLASGHMNNPMMQGKNPGIGQFGMGRAMPMPQMGQANPAQLNMAQQFGTQRPGMPQMAAQQFGTQRPGMPQMGQYPAGMPGGIGAQQQFSQFGTQRPGMPQMGQANPAQANLGQQFGTQRPGMPQMGQQYQQFGTQRPGMPQMGQFQMQQPQGQNPYQRR